MLDIKIVNGTSVHNTPIEIGIKDQKIVEVAASIEKAATEIIDAKGQYVSYGWIDAHVHCYEKMSLYYDYPDEIGIKKGVTTIIDAGSSGESNIKEFYELAKNAKTNVRALMNISKFGIVEQDELADLSKINEEINVERINELPDFIVGIKARMSKTVVGGNGIRPLEMAKELQTRFEHLPLMVHIGSAPPELSEILSHLEAGDVVTHCYNGKPNGIIDTNGEIKPFVWEAYKKGIVFDIGHGTDSFNFNVAKEAVSKGLLCQTISTDLYHRNRENGPVYDLATTLEKLLSVGFSLEEVIEKVTINPAKIFHFETKGELKPGMDADITIFTLNEEAKEVVDSNDNHVTVNHTIHPTMCLVAGNSYKIGE